VHAASFIRERRIVLEDTLLDNALDLQSILIHELFHFVWSHLGNVARSEYQELVRHEIKEGIKGETGESAGVAKCKLQAGDHDLPKSRWKNYVCESFCDTAAWFYGSRTNKHFMTLARTKLRRRELWFGQRGRLRA
jgi:hypothetical protein